MMKSTSTIFMIQNHSPVWFDTEFRSLQYALFICCFFQTIGGFIFLVMSWYVLEDKANADRAMQQVSSRKDMKQNLAEKNFYSIPYYCSYIKFLTGRTEKHQMRMIKNILRSKMIEHQLFEIHLLMINQHFQVQKQLARMRKFKIKIHLFLHNE